MSLNLASRPFVNRRPLVRIGTFLWIFAALLAITNAGLYLDYFRGSGREARLQFLELERQIAEEKAQIENQEAALARYDLPAQGAQVQFLNERIAERTFGWGQLFDRLADVLPLRVRLTQLQPQTGQGREGLLTTGDAVPVSLQGLAESGNALYEFLDQLYKHPSFEDPRLANEFLRDGTITFNLDVIYVPQAKAVAEEAQEPAEAAEPAGDEASSESEMDPEKLGAEPQAETLEEEGQAVVSAEEEKKKAAEESDP